MFRIFLFLTLFVSLAFTTELPKNFCSKKQKTWGQLLYDKFKYKGYHKSYALVIGISNYDHFKNLTTEEDALRMANYLCNQADFDYVHVLRDKEITGRKIRQLMHEAFPSNLGSSDRFLFYWSGHGVTYPLGNGGKIGYLPLASSQKKAYGSMISMTDISNWDNLLRAKQSLYLLDSCFSGLAGFQTKSDDNHKASIQRLAQSSHQILVAGNDNEETIAAEILGGSVFTTAIIEGLSTLEADNDTFQADGLISSKELEQYVGSYVQDKSRELGWNKTISPRLHDLRFSRGDFFFTNNQKANIDYSSESVQQLQVGTVVAKSDVVIQSSQLTQTFPLPKMVNIENKFEIGKYEVTIAEYKACVSDGGCKQPEWLEKGSKYNIHTGSKSWYKKMCLEDNCPIMGVSWHDAKDYTKWLSKKTRENYRLPTQKEWEYVAKAGKPSDWKWSFGNNASELKKYAWYIDNSNGTTHFVGQKLPNPWGIYDIYGNVWEWCEDWYSTEKKYKNLRGGAWLDFDDYARSTVGIRFNPTNRYNYVGFRLLRTLPLTFEKSLAESRQIS
jgi:hypothetical protein